jgi:hypothetical protein
VHPRFPGCSQGASPAGWAGAHYGRLLQATQPWHTTTHTIRCCCRW